MRAALCSDWLTPLQFFRAAIMFLSSKGRGVARELLGLASGTFSGGSDGLGPPAGGEGLVPSVRSRAARLCVWVGPEKLVLETTIGFHLFL